MQNKKNVTKTKVCRKCGGVEFASHYMAYLQCVVNGDGNWMRYLLDDQENVEQVCRNNRALGPFECLSCGNAGDTLEDITEERDLANISISLIEKPGEDGLNKTEIVNLLDDIEDEEVFPIELFAKEHESSAIGFISAQCADQLNYDYDKLEEYIASILDDMRLEHENGIYVFQGYIIKMTR
ncbi:MAG: hypothetical protein ACI4HI_18565 [Lachnospiraceae bacterium]